MSAHEFERHCSRTGTSIDGANMPATSALAELLGVTVSRLTKLERRTAAIERHLSDIEAQAKATNGRAPVGRSSRIARLKELAPRQWAVAPRPPASHVAGGCLFECPARLAMSVLLPDALRLLRSSAGNSPSCRHHRLFVELLPDHHHDFGDVVKGSVVSVALKLGQVEYRDVLLRKNAAIGFLFGVDLTEARHPAPDELRTIRVPCHLAKRTRQNAVSGRPFFGSGFETRRRPRRARPARHS